MTPDLTEKAEPTILPVKGKTCPWEVSKSSEQSPQELPGVVRETQSLLEASQGVKAQSLPR